VNAVDLVGIGDASAQDLRRLRRVSVMELADQTVDGLARALG
jgi:hypothetical protein